MAKQKYSNPFSHVDGWERNKPYAIISERQASSPHYKELSGDAVKLFEHLKLSRKYYTGTDKTGTSRAINGDCLCFYWNRELAERNGFKNPNKTLRAMRELVRNGFIEVIENNGNRRKKSVFRFSWQWQKNEIELSDASRTYLEPNKSRQEYTES